MRKYPQFEPKGVLLMFRKFAALVLVLGLLCGLAGCSEVAGEIAGNVAEAAKKELENQIKITFEKYKIEILDMKTAMGALSDSSDTQFFCAVLVQSDSAAIPQSAADTLSKLFHDAGVAVQTSQNIDNSYLQNKVLTYKYESFDDTKTYYTVWFYTDRLPTLEDLKSMITVEGIG